MFYKKSQSGFREVDLGPRHTVMDPVLKTPLACISETMSESKENSHTINIYYISICVSSINNMFSPSSWLDISGAQYRWTKEFQ